jgi:ABC-type multidrug transport system ATPase subunit/uncharacterized tellurite resistance protein B-like protein
MSEKLLESLMHLFALLAREDSVTEEETTVVKSFLYQQLNQTAAEAYMRQFVGFAGGQSTETIQSLAQRVNGELTQKQKFIVIIRLIELINADKKISESEHRAIGQVAAAFNIDSEEYDHIYQFVQSPEPHLLRTDQVLRIGHPLGGAVPERLHIQMDNYPGYVAVLRVASVDTYIYRYIGTADLFVNGHLINPDRIYFLAPGSVVRHPKHQPVYYSDIVGRFLADVKLGKVVFEAKNVTYQFPNGRVGLHQVNLFEESGRMIGLMGASGAGKSTLLNVLNGNYAVSGGQILINGLDLNKDKKQLEGVIGYVSQDDLLMEDLTVYQNLYYNAKLCFADKPEAELHAMVMKVLADLGLSETKDLKVGNPLAKKISGGQRKRLNIALELIREPAVLFVDEPTSGLSSRDSENIMDLLKELSLRGKLVFVVIHQPSSDIFKMFDKLYILDVGGYPIYYGNPVEAITYFKKRTALINADYAECGECGNVNPEQIFNIIEGKVLDEDGNPTTQRKFSPQQWNDLFLQHIALPKVQPTTERPARNLNIPNKLRQMGVFITRDVLGKIGNRAYMYINFLEAPVLALLLGFILRYYNADPSNTDGYTLYENLNLPAYLFICILVSLFMGLTVSAEEILRDRKILKREQFLNLSRSSYLLSKLAIMFAISAIQTLSFVVIGNWILGIEGMTLTYWFLLFTVSCFANMLGLNVSATFDNAVTIYILVPILLIPQIILSGVIVKFDKLNPSLAASGRVPITGDLMASRWAYEALAVHQFRDNGYERLFYDLEQRMSNNQFKQNFWLPKLESKLDFVLLNHPSAGGRAEARESVEGALSILREELGRELPRFKGADLSILDQLKYNTFSEADGKKVKLILSSLRDKYSERFNKANAERDRLMAELRKDAPVGEDPINTLKLRYHNENLSDLVTNRTDENKILELNGHLVQNADPVFLDILYNPLLSFRTQFFAPTKPFLGTLYDTYWFNSFIIWLMSAILYVTLYYESFRRGISRLGRLFGKRKS